jgi:hypothetical protein
MSMGRSIMRPISFAILSAFLLCSAPAAAKTQPEPEQQTAGNPAAKKVCRTLKITGSRMGERVCLTREEWKQVDAMAR